MQDNYHIYQHYLNKHNFISLTLILILYKETYRVCTSCCDHNFVLVCFQLAYYIIWTLLVGLVFCTPQSRFVTLR